MGTYNTVSSITSPVLTTQTLHVIRQTYFFLDTNKTKEITFFFALRSIIITRNWVTDTSAHKDERQQIKITQLVKQRFPSFIITQLCSWENPHCQMKRIPRSPPVVTQMQLRFLRGNPPLDSFRSFFLTRRSSTDSHYIGIHTSDCVNDGEYFCVHVDSRRIATVYTPLAQFLAS